MTTRCWYIAVALLVGLTANAGAAADAPLIEAVTRQDHAAVRRLLGEGADVNARQGDGATALHWAVHLGDVDTVGLLVAAGAEAGAANDLGVTPLLLASTNGNTAIVQALLDGGADPDGGRPGQENPLMRAAWSGSLDVVTTLLDGGADVRAAESGRGQTALMWAVSEGHAAVARVLVERGADVWATTVTHLTGYRARRDVAGFTPLLFAARVGSLASARLLLDAGANPNDASTDGLSALGLATVRGHVEVARLLLEYGADANAGVPGYTPLHWAAGAWETSLTIREFRADREGNDEWNALPGLRDGKIELVRALLGHGADPDARLTRTPARAGATRNGGLPELVGATPFLLAAVAGDATVMRILAEAGADTSVTTDLGSTVLMAAAGMGRVPGENSVGEAESEAAAWLAFELGADVTAVDDIGNTALHYAAYNRLTPVLQLLADEGAPLEVRNKFGETALWLADLALQYHGGGTFQIVPTSSGALLRGLGAQATLPSYDRARPRYWPDLKLQ
jgi:ankyrin repeat protein